MDFVSMHLASTEFAPMHLAPTLHLHANGAVTYAGSDEWDSDPWDNFGADIVLAVPA